jgi:ferredoxin
VKDESGGWRVEVDLDRCMGTGACAYSMPEVFAVRPDGKTMVIGAVTRNDERVSDVIAECPTAALRLVRDSPA